jgi:FkbM family methyltransferase
MPIESTSESLLTKISQQLDTLIALQRVELIKPDNIFTFLFNDREVTFWLPYAFHESMQQKILTTSNFYEIAMLRKVADIVEGAVVLDVGANIGNHTIFFSKIAGATSVSAFEPQRQVFQILERNIALNSLPSVSASNVALGARVGTLDLSSPPNFRNLGATSFHEGTAYRVETIDSLGLEVDFLKIDVEGHHMDVLRGAADTISEQKPNIWIELRKKLNEFDEANAFLSKLGYSGNSLNPDNFLYRIAH